MRGLGLAGFLVAAMTALGEGRFAAGLAGAFLAVAFLAWRFEPVFFVFFVFFIMVMVVSSGLVTCHALVNMTLSHSARGKANLRSIAHRRGKQ